MKALFDEKLNRGINNLAMPLRYKDAVALQDQHFLSGWVFLLSHVFFPSTLHNKIY